MTQGNRLFGLARIPSCHLVLLQVRRNPCELGEGGLKIFRDLVPTAGNYVISTSRSRSSLGDQACIYKHDALSII